MYIPPEIHFGDINIEEGIIGCVCVLVQYQDQTTHTLPLHRICFNFHYSLPLLYSVDCCRCTLTINMIKREGKKNILAINSDT